LVSADLYLEKIDFRRYLNQAVCEDCGFPSCEAFISAINDGTKKPHDCSFINRNQAYALEAINTIKELWPQVPLLMHPRPGFTGLIELNSPDSDSPVLVSGNNEYTEQVIMTVLETTVCPFFVLFVNSDGNTVDMAMVYQTLTAEKIHKEIKQTGLEKKVHARELLIPGLAVSLKSGIEELTGWSVRVGPVCAAELPLFLSEIWVPPDTI
jgi:CO dehydrogenase/acetyl-CoA synthase gamma subunit (corrinoid Fe-S protein)